MGTCVETRKTPFMKPFPIANGWTIWYGGKDGESSCVCFKSDIISDEIRAEVFLQIFPDKFVKSTMERLESALDVLVDETCQGLLKPKHIRAAAKKSGLKLDKKDADEATLRLVKLFRDKFRSRIDKVVADSKIEEKLANLEVLAKKCKERCEELGVEDGYRPLGVEEDLEAHIHPIMAAYEEALTTKNEELEEKIECARELLKEATDEVNQLAEKAEALMAEKDE